MENLTFEQWMAEKGFDKYKLSSLDQREIMDYMTEYQKYLKK